MPHFSLDIGCGMPHNGKLKYTLQSTAEYDAWFEVLTSKDQAVVEKRLMKITETGHFGKNPNKHKYLGEGLEELKFHDQNGMRIYFARTGETEITLLLGGYKNGQNKDIKKARSFLD
jgi:putative addiction module killer protein